MLGPPRALSPGSGAATERQVHVPQVRGTARCAQTGTATGLAARSLTYSLTYSRINVGTR